jgi:uncharacterized protein YjbJ (UPF0337 family)
MSDAAKDRARGRWDQTKGRAEEAVGDATDDESMQRRGRMDQARGRGERAEGHLKDAAKNVKEGVEDALDDHGR